MISSKLNELFERAKQETSSFEKIPDGRYLASIVSIEESVSKKGNEMLVITYKVIQSFDNNNHAVGQIERQYILLSAETEERTLSYLKRAVTFFKRIGIDVEKYSKLKEIIEILGRFKIENKLFILHVKTDKYTKRDGTEDEWRALGVDPFDNK